MSKQKHLYTVIISDHNLPNLLSVLAQKQRLDKKAPLTVFLIVTDYFTDNKTENKADNFEQVLASIDNTIHIERLPTNGLDGESFQAVHNWIEKTLIPKTHEYHNAHCILNTTGGTKIMAMELAKRIEWTEIHYKAFSQSQIQCWDPKKESLVMELELPTVRPIDIVKLYDGQAKEKTITPIESYPDAVAISQQIWDGYAQSKNYNPIEVFKHQLDKIYSPIKKKEDYIEKWLEGLWLETLVFHWLTVDGHYKKHEIARNIQTKISPRELDFMIIRDGNLYTIEAKVAPAPNAKLNEIIRQITSINKLGKLNNSLFISPCFEQDIKTDNEKKDFFESCKNNGITVLRSKEDLLKHFSRNT